jgi:hypothetical protein
MKATVKQIAAATIFAVLVVAAGVNTKAMDTKYTKFQVSETTLQIENWMTNETLWNTIAIEINEFVAEAEMDMEIENWMTDTDVWNFSTNYVEESETMLELEDWMTNEARWKTVQKSDESTLAVELWMINDKFWN